MDINEKNQNIENIRQNAEKSFDKVIIALTSGCLFLTLRNPINTMSPYCIKYLLIISWVIFTSVLIANVLSFKTASKAGEKLLKEKKNEGEDSNNNTKLLNEYCFWGFSIGLVFMLLYYILEFLCK